MELAIDTSSDIAGVALSDRGTPVAELVWLSVRNHTVELIPSVEALLNRVGSGYDSLGGIVVARGPGAFNGLRVGISAAKGLALALGVPLVGVSTLEVEAYPFAFTGLPICPVHQAGRGEIVAALFQQAGGKWYQLWEEQLMTLDALLRMTTEMTVFCGEGVDMIEAELRRKFGRRAVVPDAVARTRRASVLAELGWRRLSAGESDNVTAFQPIYLRPPHITQPRRKHDVS
ncbi:MAG: tRNA (adenosine(37)-N6)-threonylcarbamoyltransferase complex dimerization subunit type 1 TsaB [Chloroflexota bacterium]